MEVGRLYISKDDIVRLLSVEQGDDYRTYVQCIVVKLIHDIDSDYYSGLDLLPGTNFSMDLEGFRNTYNPYVEMDKELENV